MNNLHRNHIHLEHTRKVLGQTDVELRPSVSQAEGFSRNDPSTQIFSPSHALTVGLSADEKLKGCQKC